MPKKHKSKSKHSHHSNIVINKTNGHIHLGKKTTKKTNQKSKLKHGNNNIAINKTHVHIHLTKRAAKTTKGTTKKC